MKHNFKRLDIWKRSRMLVKNIYLITKSFPREETYGLTSQLRRAAVSIPSNIAEGVSRSTNPQIFHFLDISIASSCEVETQLYSSSYSQLFNTYFGLFFHPSSLKSLIDALASLTFFASMAKRINSK